MNKMQVALPVRHPVERHAVGVAVIVLAGIAATPIDLKTIDSLQYVFESPQISTVNMLQQTAVSNHKEPLEGIEVRSIKEEQAAIKAYLLDKNTTDLLNSEDKKIQSVRNSAITEISEKEINRSSDSVSQGQTGKASSTANSSLNANAESPAITDLNENSSVFLQDKVIKIALSWQGVPYLWGGSSRSGVDCSALVQSVFDQVNISLPRTSFEQFRVGIGIPLSKLKPGDLVFFSTSGPGASHVGIFIGEGKFISATKNKVEIQELDKPYWQRSYRGSRRVI